MRNKYVLFPNCILYKHQSNIWSKFHSMLMDGLKYSKDKPAETFMIILILLWHRRAGKSIISLSILAERAYNETGNYYYFLPEKRQAKDIILNAVDGNERSVIEYIPEEIILKIDRNDLIVYIKSKNYKRTKHGDTGVSTIEFKGMDADTKVGNNIKGAIFDEYDMGNRRIYTYMSPALRRNKGFSVFISTPRGYGNMDELQNKNKDNPFAYQEELTIDDTVDLRGFPIFTKEAIEKAVASGELSCWEEAEQEYYVSKKAAMIGAWYKEQLKGVYDDGRYGDHPYNNDFPLYAAFDIGVEDLTVISFYQVNYSGKFICIGSYANKDMDIKHYSNAMRNICKDNGWKEPNIVFLPHDASKRNIVNMESVVMKFVEWGWNCYSVEKPTNKINAIKATRSEIVNFNFDYGASNMLTHLLGFSKKKNPTNSKEEYDDGAIQHDEHSHFADSLETFIRGYRLYYQTGGAKTYAY